MMALISPRAPADLAVSAVIVTPAVMSVPELVMNCFVPLMTQWPSSSSARDFVPAAFDAARSEGATIQHVEVVPVSLEDVFISLTGRALRE